MTTAPASIPSHLERSEGLGLAGIREQAEILGGIVRHPLGARERAPSCASGGRSRAGRSRRDGSTQAMTTSPGEPIRVAVADDHPLFRAGRRHVPAGRAPDIEIVGEAVDAPSALALARAELPDVIVLDIAMPGGGLTAAGQIASACPATRIVMLTVSEDEDDLLAAVKAGASGYVLKGAGARELADVIRSVIAGEVYVPPALAWGMLRELRAPRTRPL